MKYYNIKKKYNNIKIKQPNKINNNKIPMKIYKKQRN